MMTPAGKVKAVGLGPGVTTVQPSMLTASAVGLKTSTQPPGKSPFGKTSLISSAGGETVILNRPVRPATVATISALPDAFPTISPVAALTTATIGKVELQLTGPASVGAPN